MWLDSWNEYLSLLLRRIDIFRPLFTHIKLLLKVPSSHFCESVLREGGSELDPTWIGQIYLIIK